MKLPIYLLSIPQLILSILLKYCLTYLISHPLYYIIIILLILPILYVSNLIYLEFVFVIYFIYYTDYLL